MAVFAALNYSIVLNSVDLSNHATKVETKWDVAELETTTFGSTFHSRIGGLQDYTGTIDFDQDFAASSVHATIAALFGTVVPLVVQPVAGARSATNPGFSASVLVKSYAPLSGSVGELAKTSIEWAIASGALSILTS